VKKISIVIALIASIMTSAPAHAAQTGFEAKISAPGASLDVVLANFPTKGGLYIQQCVQAPVGVRPTICNMAAQLWISTSLIPPSILPTAKIAFKPTSTFTSGTTAVDCTVSACGAFLRYDHTVPGDLSEDQFIALNFRSTIKNQSLGSFIVPATVQSGKKLRFPISTNEGEIITYAVAGTCSLTKTTVTVKKGACTVLASAAGKADRYTAFMGQYAIKSK
jgi:hypothetical protein